MPEYTAWPSGARDTTEIPNIDIRFDVSFREHLAAFCGMDGQGWNDYDGQREAGNIAGADTRLRTYRKLYEKQGLIYQDNGQIRLSRLGRQMASLETDLNREKENVLNCLRETSIDILSKYQLRNPIDGPELPESCDVLPCVCIWKAMRQLDNKINYEEMNRTVLHIMKMEDLDAAIARISAARAAHGNYADCDAETLDNILGERAITDQPTARIAPWFSFAGWGGLIIEQQADSDGYRNLTTGAIALVDAVLSSPPAYYNAQDKGDWLRYYTGNTAEAAESSIEDETEISQAAETDGRISFSTGLKSGYSRNRILFGAPGTGKSFTLNEEKGMLLNGGGEYERVTFHPDYSYANFVGTYKPVPFKDADGKDSITYEYIPGPFMRIYVKALKNSKTTDIKPFLLIVEEINRANVAAVFGDVFQLLDRDGDEISEYPIQASEDIRKHLSKELGLGPDSYAEIRIPDNMFIWATMNSADQGVFPMDTAFKRRWDFTYLGIDDSEASIAGKKVVLGQGEYRRTVEWNALRKAINTELLGYKASEDKLMGPYFISKKGLLEDDVIDSAEFIRVFKNKVIMYLFDDAAKQKRITLFGGCDEKSQNQYSKICAEFDVKGVSIFCEAIRNRFLPEGEGE